MKTQEEIDYLVGLTQPRHDGQTEIFSSRGNVNAKIMVVTVNPGFEDLDNHMLLSGPPGFEVDQALDAAGVPLGCAWKTCIVKHAKGLKNNKPNASDIAQALPAFEKEIACLKPKIIIALGAEAFKVLMQTNIKQGGYLGELVQSPYGPVLSTWSPFVISSVEPTKRPQFHRHFQYAARFVQDDIKFDPYEYVVVDSAEMNLQILQHYMQAGKWSIAYDLEWRGDNKYMDGEVVYSLQYACEPNKAIVLDISKDGEHENRELLDTMKVFLENPKADRLGWNIRADDKRLRHRGFNLPEETLGFDGMKAVAFFDSRIPKGLESGCIYWTNFRRYYLDLYAALRRNKLDPSDMSRVRLLEPKVFFDYGAGDAVTTYVACLRMREDLKKKPGIWQYWSSIYLPLTNYIMDMEMEGIPIDRRLMEQMTNQYVDRYNELKNDLLAQLKAIGVEDFNPNSSPDKTKLLFKTLKMEPGYYTKAGKSPKPRSWYRMQKGKGKYAYSGSANNKSISTIKFDLKAMLEKDPNNAELKQKYDIVETLLRLNRVNVFANKFLSKRGVVLDEVEEWIDAEEEEEPIKQSYWNALCSDGKIHADFYECLNNYRASSKPNVQNPASKVLSHIPDAFEGSAIEVPANLRHIFYNGGNPDWYYAEADVQGADVAIAALLSDDVDFIREILAGDFHVKKAREYFKDQTLTKSNAKSKIIVGKGITFRIFYTSELSSAILPIQADVYAESGTWVPESLIEYSLSTWNRYKRYMEYREECKRQVLDEQSVRNAYGFRYLFEKSKAYTVLPGWMNESLAYPIASALALYMWEVAVTLKKHFQKDGTWMKLIKPVNSIHDAHQWLVHKDLLKDDHFQTVVLEIFCNKTKLPNGRSLGVELVIADRWKGKNVVFEKATKWDFKHDKWHW